MPSSSDKTTDLSHLVTTVHQQVHEDALKVLAHAGYSPTTRLNLSLADTMTRIQRDTAYLSMRRQMQSYWQDVIAVLDLPSTSLERHVTDALNLFKQQE